MTEALRYETFLRRAFGLTKDGKKGILDRWGDPAGIADTDIFKERELLTVKIGVGYSMMIFNKYILNNVNELSDSEINRMESYIKKVMDATGLLEMN